MTTAVVTTEQEGAAGELRVHADASLAARVIGEVPHGAVVEVTGLAQNGFLPIAFGGLVGWASVDYLKTQGLSPMMVAAGAAGVVAIVAGVVAIVAGVVVLKKRRKAA